MIYVASSWRNPYYEKVVKRLKKEGLPVYDFRNPPHSGTGFHWTDVDENAPNWTFKEYKEGLRHPLADRQFAADFEALKAADTCVLVLPCGRSAHTEAGWMAGAGKKVIVYIPEMQEPELMYKLFDEVVDNLDDLVKCFWNGGATTYNYSSSQYFKKGFNAWVGKDPKVLILGTLPGDTSIGERQFYEDNRNSFWKLMYEILPLQQGETFVSRKEYITLRGIALWDCLASAVRNGSTDRKIVRGTERGNDIQGFLNEHPTIHTIILNGTSRTVKYYNRFCNVTTPIQLIALPSTASMTTYKKKVEAWSVLRRLVGE